MVFLFATGLILAIRTPTFQTWLVQRVTSYLSSELNTRVQLDRIEIEFFRTLNLKGLYIEDLHHDTLIYAGELRVVIEMFAPNENKIFLGGIELENATVKIQKYKNEKGLNFKFLADYFDSGKKDTVPTPKFEFNPGEITLSKVQFVYRDNRYDDVFQGVDFEDIRVRDLEATIDDIRFESDTVLANIQNLSFVVK